MTILAAAFVVSTATVFGIMPRLAAAQFPATTQAVTSAAPSASTQGGTASPAISHVAASPESFFDFYAKNLRQSLFSGFLTLGSFLVAVNTFIVVNLKKELYDHPSYRKKVKANRDQERKNRQQPTKTPDDPPLGASFYGPLKRLSSLLLCTIAVSLFTAVSQLTIGVFVKNAFGAGVCLASAGMTILMLGYVLWIIRQNLRDWFGHWEEQACQEEQNDREGSDKA